MTEPIKSSIKHFLPIFFYSIRTRVCNLSHRPLVVVIKNADLRPFCINLTSDLKATSIIYIIIQIQIKEVHLENISSNKSPKCKSQHALKFNAINFDTTIRLLQCLFSVSLTCFFGCLYMSYNACN